MIVSTEWDSGIASWNSVDREICFVTVHTWFELSWDSGEYSACAKDVQLADFGVRDKRQWRVLTQTNYV